MDKFCIFCGKKPVNKTEEHVIPKWLLELTGNQSRNVNLGLIKEPGGGRRNYAFSSFVFPACARCNNDYAYLEGRAQSIIEKLINYKNLSSLDMNWLLDWFDKVRIGLWLGNYYLDKNWLGIAPQISISTRIGLHDRFLGIYHHPGLKNHISFTGTESVSFTFMPCCFAMTLNQFSFINISAINLISRELGFPYCKPIKLIDLNAWQVEVFEGTEKTSVPDIHYELLMNGTEIYQPMFSYNLRNDKFVELFDSKYVKDNCIDFKSGIGKIFILNNDEIEEYPKESSDMWIPDESYAIGKMYEVLPLRTIHVQEYLDSLIPYDKDPPEEFKNRIQASKEMRTKWNEFARESHARHFEYLHEKFDLIKRVADSYKFKNK